jgi:hypothetical protein
MVIGIQIAGLAFALVMLYTFFINYKKNDITRREFNLWLLFWLLFIILTLYPPILDPILGTLNFTRALDFFAVMGILFLVIITLHNYLLVKRTKRRVEVLVRKLALNKKVK